MIKKLFVVMVGLLVLPMMANATVVDLTLPAPQSGEINGAIFSTPGGIVSGSGRIDSFVRINPGGSQTTEQGYNTSGRLKGNKLEFDENTSLTFTHDLLLSDLQNNKVEVGGIEYYEVVLDINETKGGSLLSLYELEIYVASSGGLIGYPSSLGTLVYDLDGIEESRIELDYNLQGGAPGSGRIDMIALFPTSLFTDDYIYLYSAFGNPQGCDDGYEEWARAETGTFTGGDVPGATPEPGTLILLGSGLAGLAGYGKLRFRRKRK